MQLKMSISILKVMQKITLSECHWSGQCGTAPSEFEFRCQFNQRFSYKRC